MYEVSNIIVGQYLIHKELKMPYINKDNLPIHYHVKGSGPALVQLHGFTGSLVDFNMEPYLQLEENYTLIQIDLRGHGLSMKLSLIHI